MKQYVIDISGQPADGTMGRASIRFYKRGHDTAAVLEQGLDNHENTFGCYIRSNSMDKVLMVDTVEHAEKLIEALQLAISEGWLFTEAQLEKHHKRATDTRRTIRDKIRTDAK